MKILVVGAGYVGMPLLAHLRQQCHDVHVTTTQKERMELLRRHAEEVILLEASQDKFKGLIDPFDAIVLLVAPNRGKTYQETYLETAKAIRSALQLKKSPCYLLYTSSTSVYRGIESEWVSEEAVCNPPSENGKVLVEAERLILSWPDSCVLRLGGIYGPGRELVKRALYFSGKILGGEEGVATNHVHLDDIVHALGFCLQRHLVGLYNLVNNDHPTRGELYSTLSASVGASPPILTLTSEPQGVQGYKVSNQKITEAGFLLKFNT